MTVPAVPDPLLVRTVNVYVKAGDKPVYVNPDAVAVFEDPSEQLIV